MFAVEKLERAHILKFKNFYACFSGEKVNGKGCFGH